MNTRLTAQATLFSLLINLLLPFFAMYTPVSAADEYNPEMLVVCTSQGVKLIDQVSFEDGSYLLALDSYETVADEELPQTSPHLECGVCFLAQMQLDQFSMWSPRIDVAMSYQRESLNVFFHRVDHALWSPSGSLTRAPPSLSV